MPYAAVFASDDNDMIGINNSLPWRTIIPDIMHFRKLTFGHIVVMGMNTFRSIKKPLIGRINIIISRTPAIIPDTTVMTLEKFRSCDFGKLQVYIIGGGEIFRELLPICIKIYRTAIRLQYTPNTSSVYVRIPNTFTQTAGSKTMFDDEIPYEFQEYILFF